MGGVVLLMLGVVVAGAIAAYLIWAVGTRH